MRKNIFTFAFLLMAGLSLAACGSTDAGKMTISIPDIVEYDEDFRIIFADELDTICGNPTDGVVDELPKTCTFVRDTIELRSRLRDLQDK